MMIVKPNSISTGNRPLAILKAALEVPKKRCPAIAPSAKGIKKDLKLPLSIIIAAIIIAGAIYYSSTSDYRNALKACEALMMSDGSVTKKDLKLSVLFN